MVEMFSSKKPLSSAKCNNFLPVKHVRITVHNSTSVIASDASEYVTQEHKISHKCQFFEIEIYASSES